MHIVQLSKDGVGHSGRPLLLQVLPHSRFVLPYKGSKVGIVIFIIQV